MLPANEEQDPYNVYQVQLGETRRLAQEMCQEKARLEALVQQARQDVCQDVQDAEREKLKFISGQVAAAQLVVKKLYLDDMLLANRDFIDPPSEEERARRNRFYREATHLLRAIETSFRLALRVDTLSFKPVFEHFQGLIEQHPVLLQACGGGGAVLGALLGAGAHGLVWPHGILHLGLHRLLSTAFGNVGAVVVGGAGGCLVGLVLGIVVIELVDLAVRIKRSADAPSDERARLRTEMDEVLAAMEQGMTAESTRELADLFERYFNAPMLRALSGDLCPICMEGFPASGGNSREQATKSPSCVGNHLVHRQCQLQWVQWSGSEACVICRQ
mmetsp:Transcript_88418/g.245475  ORF Transcript_88418/g.245475 Transcript_88418/m.245475 type:complete len:331 (-) Transcript_88418:379-1371(-)